MANSTDRAFKTCAPAAAISAETGTVAAINAALDGLSFAPGLNFNGAASLQIVTNDQGNTGAGGPLSDTDTVAITVTAVDDAPVNTVPAAQTVHALQESAPPDDEKTIRRVPARAAASMQSRTQAPVARSGSSDDVTATLAKLADLRDKGAITPAEYEAKKAELLGRL